MTFANYIKTIAWLGFLSISTGVHAKSNATSKNLILVTELMASTILASHIWFICCSLGLHTTYIVRSDFISCSFVIHGSL